MVCIRINCGNLNCTVITKEGKEEAMYRVSKYKLRNIIVLAVFFLILYTVAIYWIISAYRQTSDAFIARQIEMCETAGYTGYMISKDEVTCLD